MSHFHILEHDSHNKNQFYILFFEKKSLNINNSHITSLDHQAEQRTSFS